MKKKLILGCDTGIDDALAICYAAGQREMELIGITVSYGMSSLGNTYRNTRYLAGLLGIPVKVWMGSEAPLERAPRDYTKNGSRFHGMDGLNNQLGQHRPEDVAGARPEDVAGARPEEAVDFLIESVRRYGEDLVLVTTGPLTDLARAIGKDPSIARRVGRVVSMAGAVASPGNIDPVREANVALDPEAAKAVLESELPLTLVGLDVTRKTLLTGEDHARMRRIGTARSDFLCRCLEGYLDAYRKFHPYLDGCALHDPLAVGAALHPEWLTTIPMHLTCVVSGEMDGRTCEDLSRCGDDSYRSEAAFMVDKEAFQRHFFATVEEVLRKEGDGSERATGA